MPEDIWVDIPNRTFSFKDGAFNFTLRIGSSNDDDCLIQDFSRRVKGKGDFEFSSSKSDLTINEFEVEFNLDLFE